MNDEQIKKAFSFTFEQFAEIIYKISKLEAMALGGIELDLCDISDHFDRKYKEIFEEEK